MMPTLLRYAFPPDVLREHRRHEQRQVDAKARERGFLAGRLWAENHGAAAPCKLSKQTPYVRGFLDGANFQSEGGTP